MPTTTTRTAPWGLNVLDIARRLHAASAAFNRADRAQGEICRDSKEWAELDTRKDFLFDERLALQKLFPVLEPTSLADTAVYAAMAFYSIDYEIDSDSVGELQRAYKKTERSLAVIARRLAIEAGVDLAQFGETDLLRMMDWSRPVTAEREHAPDAELIAACAEAARCEKWRTELNGLPGDTDDEPIIITMNRAWRAAFERVAQLPANTPAGIQAKAAALRLATEEYVTQSGPHFTMKDGDLHERLAVSLCDDIARGLA
jgi:hypothetical protein